MADGLLSRLIIMKANKNKEQANIFLSVPYFMLFASPDAGVWTGIRAHSFQVYCSTSYAGVVFLTKKGFANVGICNSTTQQNTVRLWTLLTYLTWVIKCCQFGSTGLWCSLWRSSQLLLLLNRHYMLRPNVARLHTCTSKFDGHKGVGIGTADLRQILGPINVDQHLRARPSSSHSQAQLSTQLSLKVIHTCYCII